MTLETLETPPADNTEWWDAFEKFLAANHAWEEASKLAWLEIDKKGEKQ